MDTTPEGGGSAISEMETARIEITRVLSSEGADTHFVEMSDELGFIEALGLVEAAKDTITRMFMGEFDGSADE